MDGSGGPIRIELCGRLAAQIDGVRVEERLRGRQGRELFAYLVVNRGRQVERAELVEALWPSGPPPRAGAALSSLLSVLRRAVGGDRLRGRSELQLTLPDDAWIDLEVAATSLERSRAAIASAEWELAWGPAHAATAIAERGFLPGHEALWIEARRRELEELLLEALEAVAAIGLKLGGSELPAAERAARRLVELAPYRESGYAALMELKERQGNAAEALQVYDRLARLLVEELGTTPGPRARDLHQRLLAGGAGGRGGRAGGHALALPPHLDEDSRPFVGRRAELGRLDEQLREVIRGARRTVLLEGEPGIGKTRLAAEFARRAHQHGASVLYGRSFEQAVVSYEPFVNALRRYVASVDAATLRAQLTRSGGELALIVPELTERLPGLPEPIRGDPDGERFRAFDAVAELLARASEAHPVVFVLDDVHWADEGSILLLRHIARHPSAARLLLVGAYREAELSAPAAACLAELRRDGLAASLPLSGLSETDVDDLVAAWGGEQRLARALWRETEGNPFFVAELLEHLRETGEGGAPAAAIDLRGVGVPRNVAALIEQRLARLGEPLDRVLPVAAVLGRSFSLELLEPLAETPSEELSERLEAAISAGLVVESEEPGRYGFSHGLVRQTLYEGLSATRRRRIHRRAAEALERQDGSPAQLAHHFLAGGEQGDAAKAAEYARRAADEAVDRLAYEEAVDWLGRGVEALEGVPGEDGRRCELLLATGRAQLRAGDPSGARAMFGRAAELARRIGAGEQLAWAALEFGVRYPEAGLLDEQLVGLLEGALAALPRRDSPLRAMVLARLGQSLYYSPDRERWRRTAEEGIAMARRVGDERALARVLASTTFWDPDDHGRRSEVADELAPLAERIDDKELILLGRHWRSWNLLELGDRAGAEREREAVDRVAMALRQPFLQRFSARWRVVQALLDGRLGEVEGLVAEAVETGQHAQSDDAGQIAALQLLLLRREEGRVAELLPAVREFGERHPLVPAWRCGTALAHAEAGDMETAAASYETFAAERFANIPRDVFWLVGLTFLAEACAWLGDRERAPALREALAPYADRVVIVGDAACLGPAARPLALVESLIGCRQDAERSFETALEISRNLGSPPIEAHICVDFAALLAERGGPGDDDRAANLLDRAAQTAERLTMARLKQRVAAVA